MSAYRKKIYDYIENEGLEMTEERHNELKRLLIEYSNLENFSLKEQAEQYVKYFTKRKLNIKKELEKHKERSFLPEV